MLTLPPDGVGGVLNAKKSADPPQGLVEALLGEDEASQVCLHIPGHEEVYQCPDLANFVCFKTMKLLRRRRQNFSSAMVRTILHNQGQESP